MKFAIIVKALLLIKFRYGHGMEIPWVIEEQTKVKHQLLQNYIAPWMSILFSQQQRLDIPQRLLYFDGFSGPGIYYEDNTKSSTCLGSPLIVAEIANKYLDSNPNREIDIICVDSKEGCVKILSQKLDDINEFNQYWKVFHAEFDETVNLILDEIDKKGLTTPPMFFFIDPFGYSGFPITTLRKILEYPRAELFINFMIYDIVRFCDVEKFEERMKQLYGCMEFKNVRSSDKHIYLTNLYCQQLKQLAGAEFVMPFRVNTPEQMRRPRYYLIHVSNNIKALKVMKDNMSRVSDSEYSFQAIGISSQASLFEDPEKTDIRDKIKNYCYENPSNIDYNEIEEWAYVNTNGVSKTIKEALLILEEEQTIEILRLARQRKSTVTKGAKINYLGS